MLITERKKLDQQTLIELDQFLTRQDALSLVELHGFLTAVISGPRLINLSEWLEVAGIADIDFDSKAQARWILDSIMALYHAIAQQLAQQTYQPLLTLCQPEPLQEKAALEKAAALWAQGYLMGISIDFETWFAVQADEAENQDDLATLLFPIMALALKEEVLQAEITASGMDKTPDAIREMGIQLLPDLVSAIYDYWLAWDEVPVLSQNVPLPVPKIGRNEPCPCGSGKKYKKCCLQ